jgi:hypothetical protein
LQLSGGPYMSEMLCEFRWSMQHLLASLLAGVWKAVASGSSTRSTWRLNQRRRKTLGFLFAHKRHPFNRRCSAGWCCIDLLNSPRFSDKWIAKSSSTSRLRDTDSRSMANSQSRCGVKFNSFQIGRHSDLAVRQSARRSELDWQVSLGFGRCLRNWEGVLRLFNIFVLRNKYALIPKQNGKSGRGVCK